MFKLARMKLTWHEALRILTAHFAQSRDEKLESLPKGTFQIEALISLPFLYMHADTSTIAKAALLNEIRTLKKAGRHPNIVSLIGM